MEKMEGARPGRDREQGREEEGGRQARKDTKIHWKGPVIDNVLEADGTLAVKYKQGTLCCSDKALCEFPMNTTDISDFEGQETHVLVTQNFANTKIHVENENAMRTLASLQTNCEVYDPSKYKL